jgi:hypothetical protein
MSRRIAIRNAVIAVVAGLLIQLAFVFSFVVAQVDPEPHQLPLGVVGAEPAVAQVEQALERERPGGFELTVYDGEDAAREAIGDRDVYGALVLEPGSLRLLTASAASPAVATLLEGVARGIAQAGGVQLQVEDVRPIDPDDPRGLLFNLLLLPFVVTAVLTPLFLRFLAPPVRAARQALALAAFAVIGALVSVLIAGPATGALPGGDFFAAWGIVALLLFAVAAPTGALIAARGVAGAGIAFLLFLIIGNIASGAASAPELLPGFWRFVGEYLPPGAAATALRNTMYFDGVALLQPLLVLVVFSLAGVVLELVLGRRQMGIPLFESVPGTEPQPEPPSASREHDGTRGPSQARA